MAIKTYTVQYQQNMVDVVLQVLGDARYLVDVAQANGLSITEPLVAGQVLLVPDVLSPNVRVLEQYAARGVVVATGDVEVGGDWNDDFNNDYQ